MSPWEFQDPKMEVLYHIFGHILRGYSHWMSPCSQKCPGKKPFPFCIIPIRLDKLRNDQSSATSRLNDGECIGGAIPEELHFTSVKYVLVGGLEHEIYDFPFSWEFHNPNWRSPSFLRGTSNPWIHWTSKNTSHDVPWCAPCPYYTCHWTSKKLSHFMG